MSAAMASPFYTPENLFPVNKVEIDYLQKRIDEARNGHLDAFFNLQELLPKYLKFREKGQLLMSLGFLDMLFFHLRSALIPWKLLEPGCAELISKHPAWELAVVALGCLLKLSPSGGAAWQPSVRDVRRIHKGWPDVFAWSNFIFLEERRPALSTKRVDILLLLGGVWNNLRILDSQYGQAILAIPGALSLVIRYWKFLTEPQPYPIENIRLGSESSFLVLISTLPQVDPPLRVGWVRSALGFNSNDALAAFLTKKLTYDDVEYPGIVRMLLVLTEGAEESFLLALQQTRTLRKMISLITTLSSANIRDADVIISALWVCIVRVVRSGNGVSGLYHALRLGFFQAYLGCSNVLHENSILNNNLEDDDGLASFPSDIKHLVVGQMLDPHIFGTLKKVFYDINGVPTFQLRQKKLADRSDSFAKAWMDVITVFEEIQRLVPDNTVIFSLEDRRKECFNHQCPNRSSTSASNCGLKFKTCVRCHGAWYCSRRCQRTDYQIHQYFCHSPAVGSAQELLRPASILTIKSFTSSVVYSYLVRSGREEQVKYSQASCTDDHNKDIAASVMISLEPFRIESNFHPFRGSELEKAYHTIGSEGERKKLWMNHPHILKARGVSKDKVDKDVVVHLDITVPRSLKEAQYRIHAICLLSMLVA